MKKPLFRAHPENEIIPLEEDLKRVMDEIMRLRGLPMVTDDERSQWDTDAERQVRRRVNDHYRKVFRELRTPLNYCGGLMLLRGARRFNHEHDGEEDEVPMPADLTRDAIRLAAIYDNVSQLDILSDDETDGCLEREGHPNRVAISPNTTVLDCVTLVNMCFRDLIDNHPFDPKDKHRLITIENLEEMTHVMRTLFAANLMEVCGAGHDRKEGPPGRRLKIDSKTMARSDYFLMHRGVGYVYSTYNLAAQLVGRRLGGQYEDPKFNRPFIDLITALVDIFAGWDDIMDWAHDFQQGTHSLVNLVIHLLVFSYEKGKTGPELWRQLGIKKLPRELADKPPEWYAAQRRELDAIFGRYLREQSSPAETARLEKRIVNFVSEIHLRELLIAVCAVFGRKQLLAMRELAREPYRMTPQLFGEVHVLCAEKMPKTARFVRSWKAMFPETVKQAAELTDGEIDAMAHELGVDTVERWWCPDRLYDDGYHAGLDYTEDLRKGLSKN